MEIATGAVAPIALMPPPEFIAWFPETVDRSNTNSARLTEIAPPTPLTWSAPLPTKDEERTVTVELRDGGRRSLTARGAVVLALGSAPAIPPAPG